MALTKADNELLTRVGAGTPMGDLMRRYWQPALLSWEVDEKDGAPVRVRLLGEDLVAIWRNVDQKRFQNYRATFTLLDEPVVSRGWIDAVLSGQILDASCPSAWRAVRPPA